MGMGMYLCTYVQKYLVYRTVNFQIRHQGIGTDASAILTGRSAGFQVFMSQTALLNIDRIEWATGGLDSGLNGLCFVCVLVWFPVCIIGYWYDCFCIYW